MPACRSSTLLTFHRGCHRRTELETGSNAYLSVQRRDLRRVARDREPVHRQARDTQAGTIVRQSFAIRAAREQERDPAGRHDHGSVYMSEDFQNELRFPGMQSSPAYVRQPEGNGCIERFFRTLKEQMLWLRTFTDLAELSPGAH